MRNILLAAAALGALGMTVPATAQESVAVAYSDLNLATSEGQRTLDGRIDRAARNVCGMDQQRVGTRIRSSDSVKCYRAALANAQQRVAAIVRNEQLGG
jgi:UrcA family protein